MSTQTSAQKASAAGSGTVGNDSIALPQEHWNVLSARSSSLQPLPPITGEVNRFPSFTREMIRLRWRTNDPVDIYVIRPNDVENPPVVLYLYGYPTEIAKFRNDDFCRYATQHGFAAVGFVSALTGHRYHDRPMKEWFVSELQEALAKSTHDVQMLLDYLDSRHDLDMQHVGMYGQGSGGTIAILSAVADARIKSVDVMDPWGDWSDWLAQSPQIPNEERPNYLKPDFIVKAAGLDPVVWLPLLKDRPLRIQENVFNPAMPSPVRARFEAAVPANGTLAEYQTAEEYKNKVSTDGRMLDWLESSLQRNPAEPSSKNALAHDGSPSSAQ